MADPFAGLFTTAPQGTSVQKKQVFAPQIPASGGKFANVFADKIQAKKELQARMDAAKATLDQSPAPVKLRDATISQAPEKVWPLGFIGKAAKAAYETVKSNIDNAASKLTDAFDALDSSGIDLKTYESAPGVSAYTVDGKPNPNYQTELKARQDYFDKSHKVTKVERATKLGQAAVATGNLALLPVTAEMSAAQEVPVIKYPAKAANFVFEKLGGLGSKALGAAVEALPVKQETKDTLKPLAEELGALTAQLVGVHLAGTVAERGLNLKGLPLSEEARTRISKVAQLTAGVSMQPFSTAFGIASGMMTQKVHERQAKGIDITPEEGQKILAEIKQELPDEVAKFVRVTAGGNHGIFEVQKDGHTIQVRKPFQPGYEAPTTPTEAPVVPKTDITATEAPKMTDITAPPDPVVTSAVPEVPAGGAVQPIEGTGATKARGLSTGVEAKAVENKLTKGFGDLPEYQSVDMKDQAQKASDLIAKEPDRARRIAMGEESAPKDVIPESVFIAVEEKAIREGDVNTLRDLATRSSLTSEATTMGQRIRTLAERDPESPVGAIQEVQKAREESAKKKSLGKDIAKAKKEITAQIKESIKKATPKSAWNDFVQSIKC